MDQQSAEERYRRGLEVVDKVYGPGSSDMMTAAKGVPFVDEIVNHLFADVWSRAALSMRDRRLLVIGATAMLGRDDLIETQVKGGILNGEFTDEQLAEIPLLMLFYAGAGNTTMTFRGVSSGTGNPKPLRNPEPRRRRAPQNPSAGVHQSRTAAVVSIRLGHPILGLCSKIIEKHSVVFRTHLDDEAFERGHRPLASPTGGRPGYAAATSSAAECARPRPPVREPIDGRGRRCLVNRRRLRSSARFARWLHPAPPTSAERPCGGRRSGGG